MFYIYGIRQNLVPVFDRLMTLIGLHCNNLLKAFDAYKRLPGPSFFAFVTKQLCS